MLRAFGDGKIFGEAYGDGATSVVWLHGWGRSGRDFAAAASDLAGSGVSSVALDLPGFGASPPPERPGGAHLYAAAVADVVASLPVGPVVLVGHSFGGRVAIVLAATRPELVRGVVLTGTPLVRLHPASRPPWRYRALRALRRRGVISESRMERARQRYGSRDYREARGVVRDVLVASVAESYEGEMAKVTAPVWLLWGAADHEVPVAVAERARDLFPGAVSMTVLAGVGHFVPTEATVALVSTVREAIG